MYRYCMIYWACYDLEHFDRRDVASGSHLEKNPRASDAGGGVRVVSLLAKTQINDCANS